MSVPGGALPPGTDNYLAELYAIERTLDGHARGDRVLIMCDCQAAMRARLLAAARLLGWHAGDDDDVVARVAGLRMGRSETGRERKAREYSVAKERTSAECVTQAWCTGCTVRHTSLVYGPYTSRCTYTRLVRWSLPYEARTVFVRASYTSLVQICQVTSLVYKPCTSILKIDFGIADCI